MSLEYSWKGLKNGYYLLRGRIKYNSTLCKGKLLIGRKSYTLPIAGSGKINHIVKIEADKENLRLVIPLKLDNSVIEPASIIKEQISIKRLSFFEVLYHFYRRIFGVFFSREPINKQLKYALDLSLKKALINPETTYYRISYLRYIRVCGFKNYNNFLVHYRELEKRYWRERQKPTSPKLLVIVLKENGKLLDRTINSIKDQVCPPDEILVLSNSNLSFFLERAKGDYVMFLREGDLLSPSAVCCFKAFARHKGYPEVVYADNDYIGEDGTFSEPCFKPNWSPDYFFEYDYIKFPVAFKREVLKYKEFTSNYEIILGLLKEQKNLRIAHIPALLGSKYPEEERYYQRLEKLRDFLGDKAEVKPAKEPITFRVLYKPSKEPKVSIIIPTKDKPELIENCINSLLEKTDYPNYEIVIVDNGSKDPKVWQFYQNIKTTDKVILCNLDIPFNFSKLVNYGVSKAKGEMICLLNNDTEVITDCWLREMVAHALRQEVGVVGAKLLYPDHTVQHGGVVMGIWNGADHAFKGVPDGDGYIFRLSTTQNYLTVTAACMLFRKDVFYEVGGFDEAFEVDFNDVDFCLKVFEKGYKIVWTPYAVLYHFESKSKNVDDKQRAKREASLLRRRWKKYIKKDPYYNPNLTFYGTNFEFNPLPWFYCLE